MDAGGGGFVDIDEEDGANRPTVEQWMYLLNAISGDMELRGNFSGAGGKSRTAMKWAQLTVELNELPGGVIKDAKQWHSAYGGLKTRAKNSLARKLSYMTGTGGGPPMETVEDLAELGISDVHCKCIIVAKLKVNAMGNRSVPNPLQVQHSRESGTSLGGVSQRQTSDPPNNNRQNGASFQHRPGPPHEFNRTQSQRPRGNGAFSWQGAGAGGNTRGDERFISPRGMRQYSKSPGRGEYRYNSPGGHSSKVGYGYNNSPGGHSSRVVYGYSNSPGGHSSKVGYGYNNSPGGHYSRGGFSPCKRDSSAAGFSTNGRAYANSPSQRRGSSCAESKPFALQDDDDIVLLSPERRSDPDVTKKHSVTHTPKSQQKQKRPSSSPAFLNGKSPVRKRLPFGDPRQEEPVSAKTDETLLSLVTGMRELQTAVDANTAALKTPTTCTHRSPTKSSTATLKENHGRKHQKYKTVLPVLRGYITPIM